jgi:hypothetical protein
MQGQQPGREANGASARKSRDVGVGPDRPTQQKILTGIFPTPALMFFGAGVFFYFGTLGVVNPNHDQTI